MILVKLARDLTRPISPKWWLSKGIPLISGKSRLVKYYFIWPDDFTPLQAKPLRVCLTCPQVEDAFLPEKLNGQLDLWDLQS